jgi:D-alanyl-D-alanine carboxypeptidase/D-alanyl-D-alanine-endopeptidase (penicillin-binding protein 4)
MAEQLLKTLSPGDDPATFQAALTRVQAQLQRRGVELSTLRLGNGSGLYDTNRVSAHQLTQLLTSMYRDFRVRPDYLASLAIMGTDGTMRNRLRDTEAQRWARAKTGTLANVSALSGYIGAPARDPVVFSILFNALRRSDRSQARAVQNLIVDLVARYLHGEPLSLESDTSIHLEP